MTEKLVELLRSEQRYTQTTQALHFVCGALAAYDSAKGADPFQGLDVERVFAAVELLARRHDLEVAPFVSSWHEAVDEWDRPRRPAFLARDFRHALARESDNSLDRVINRILDTSTGTGRGSTYRQLAHRMIAGLRLLVATTPKQAAYLAPLIDLGQQQGGLTVATLNYDLAVEQVGAQRDVDVHTGIERWTTDRRWIWPRDGIRLLKLHGSIDWCWEELRDRPGHLPTRVVATTSDPAGERRAPVVAFGHGEKLQPRGPFLSLLAEFERLLARASRLVVVGYSFRDTHINQAIEHWSSEDEGRTITIIDPVFPERAERNTFRTALTTHLNNTYGTDPRPERVTIMRSKASAGIKQLYG